MSITHPEMVAQLAKNGEDIIKELTPCSAHILHMAVGIAGEAGEILEQIHNKTSIGEVDEKNLIEELGDLEFYMEGFRQEMGFSRDQTMSVYNSDDFKHHGESINEAHLAAADLAMCTLKLLDEAKKFSVYVKPANARNMLDDLIEIEICLEHVRQHFDILHSECIEHNIHKLYGGENARYKEGKFSNEQAQNRADKQ